MSDPLYEAGSRARRAVLGDQHVDRAAAAATEFSGPWQDYLTRAAWGGSWARTGLDRRTRSMLTLALLATLRCEPELALHVRAAVGNGLSAEEIREVLIHTAVYAGVPAANAAFDVAGRVLAELGVPAATTPFGADGEGSGGEHSSSGKPPGNR